MTATHLPQALAAHQAGDLPQAEWLYREILAVDPQSADTLHLLGILLHQRGELTEACRYIQEAIRLFPNIANFHNSLGNVLHGLGQNPDALESFRKAMTLAPEHPDGYLNAGLILEEQQQYETALSHYDQALLLDATLPAGHNNRGNVFLALNRLDEAAPCFAQALALDPRFYRAHYNQCQLYERLGQMEAAIRCCQQAIALAPDFAEGFEKLGGLYFQQGQQLAAKEAYQSALRLNPDDVIAAQNLGTVCLALDHVDDALTSFQTVLRLNPNHPDALYGLGDALVNLNRMEEAIACYEQAQVLKPSDAHRVKMAMFFPFIYQSNEEIATWRQHLKTSLATLASQPLTIENPVLNVGRTPFYLPYQGFNDIEIQQAFAQILGPHVPKVMLSDFNPNQRPRIGFVSKYFRKKHTIGKVMEGIIQHLDRNRFDVYLLMMDNGGLSQADPIQTQPQDRLIELPLWNTAQAADKVATLNLDILVYTDIGMEPSTYFMGFSRLAPIQCVTWGHPITTGLPEMDYYLSCQDFEVPSGQDHYSEKLIPMKHIPAYYRRPSLGAVPKTRADLGLPAHTHLYVCPQSLYKIHPDFDPILGEILRRDPEGKALFFDGLHPALNQELLRRWEKTIPDVLSQIEFIGRVNAETFYNYLALTDVMLDPVHFGGGNTSLEALSFGTPIVTLPKSLMHGRFTYGFYTQMGVMDCIADSPEAYVEIATRLGKNPDERQRVKEKILAANSVLYENQGVVREWENFFSEVLEKYRAK